MRSKQSGFGGRNIARNIYHAEGESGDQDSELTGMHHERSKNQSRTIPERVAQFYYTLGLFCSSHPIIIIISSITVVLISCYPLLSLPLPGNKPQEFFTTLENFTVPPVGGWDGSDWPRWYKGSPVTYVQQIIVKSAVLPWNTDLILTDAFRAPLGEVFHVLDTIKMTKIDKAKESVKLQNICFPVGEVKSRALKGKVSMLPEFNCLIVSPANFWQQKYLKFQEDPDLLGTILNFQSHQKGRSGLAEILLGMNVKDTGLKRYPFKARQRIVTYAITLILKDLDLKFLQTIESSLGKIYSKEPEKLDLEGENNSSGSESVVLDEKRIFHIYFPAQTSLFELVPLIITYIAMFFYTYFSVRKVEIITSKLGMAFSALATVLCSLCMSVGLCSHFGMVFEINPKAIFPYLVVIIGLENILVLTRSVVSTATHLDVKIRVAQGLSREGWSITKNLLTEVTILTIGFFTFVPMIQEFCILAIVGLLSDFFLQTFFFATILSIDIRRTEISVESKPENFSTYYAPFRTPLHPSKLSRIKSNPRINQNGYLNHEPVPVVAPSHSGPILVKIPKRIRLVYFWARTRFFQRTFMIFMVGWISIIIYQSGIVAHFNYPDPAQDVVVPLKMRNEEGNENYSRIALTLASNNFVLRTLSKKNETVDQAKTEKSFPQQETTMGYQNKKVLRELYVNNPNSWRRLGPFHWQVLMGIYNVSLSGRYISVLPPICISVPLDPNLAASLRHPYELEQAKKFNWQALTNAFDPIDFTDEYESKVTLTPIGKIGPKGLISSTSEDPYVPNSPIELALTMLLAIPSLIFVSYMLFVFYKCICSRNYAEWRTSWTKNNSDTPPDAYTQVVFEAVPLVLDGHTQEVECIGNDGNLIASVCLAGVLKVWNTTSAENIITVDRKSFFGRLSALEKHQEENCAWGISDNDSTSCSPSNTSAMNFEMNDRPSSGKRIGLYNQIQNQSFDLPSKQSHKGHSRNNSISYPIFSSASGSQPDMTGGMNHRRTPSIPSNLCLHNQSPPIQIPGQNRQNLIGSRGGNVENCGCSSEHLNSIGNSDSRVNSPLEKISEGNMRDEAPSVWCLDSQENIVVLGTGSGRLEFWDAYTGYLKCTYEDQMAGVTCVKIIGSKIIVARLNGSLDFVELESSNGLPNESPSPYHRWHGGADGEERIRPSLFSFEADLKCNWITTLKAHQQPITCLDCEGGKILTGSQDHTLKVIRLEDHFSLYTLHGHYGPITCLFIDKICPMTSGSGSQDGMLCVWDLSTGMCMYSIQAHDGPLCGLTYSASYIISVGGDDKICVWERFQGHLLNTIQLDHPYCSSLVMLTHNLLITSKQGSLIVWDVRSGEPVRIVRLGHRDNAIFVRQIMGCADAILCDYGSQLRLVRFPTIISKLE